MPERSFDKKPLFEDKLVHKSELSPHKFDKSKMNPKFGKSCTF